MLWDKFFSRIGAYACIIFFSLPFLNGVVIIMHAWRDYFMEMWTRMEKVCNEKLVKNVSVVIRVHWWVNLVLMSMLISVVKSSVCSRFFIVPFHHDLIRISLNRAQRFQHTMWFMLYLYWWTKMPVEFKNSNNN